MAGLNKYLMFPPSEKSVVFSKYRKGQIRQKEI